MNIKSLRVLCLLFAFLLVLVMLSGCTERNRHTNAITSAHQLTTERVGVQAGTLYEEGLLRLCPDVEVVYYTVPTDMLVALDQGRLDYFLTEDITYQIEKKHCPWLVCLDGAVCSTPIGTAISSHSRYPLLQSQLEAFMAEMESSGKAKEMRDYWLNEFDPDTCVVDRSGITGENGTVAVAVENGYEPFSYYVNGELQGFDIDFVYRFCREYGYKPAFYSVEYDAIPVGIGTGKYDMGMSVVISEERSENVTIVGPYVTLEVYAVTKGSAAEDIGFFSSLTEKFEETFIKENRWLLFVQGAGTTLLITVLSAIFGTCFGFVLYLLGKKSRWIDKANGFAGWLIGGIPTILLLMVLYYLVFVDWATIDGIWVAIIGFTILFGYTILEILVTSVSAISKGQEEGARALGYNSTQTLFHVVLPQALRVALPQIKSELISLIKETSIVGYISIADLTRMSDIVRGRTYEAFFPLITTTVIYFVLIGLILFVVKRIEIEMTFRPIRIKRIKKGIHIK